MSVASYVRRHLNNLIDDKPFSIRDFLIYGPRSSIDQIFQRLLKEVRVYRVARGVYMKDTSPQPSIDEIVKVKAAAFGRTIATHGAAALNRLTNKRKGILRLTFACSGATSSFRIGNLIVRFKRASARKMQQGDSPVGLVIRALWHLGKCALTIETAAQVVSGFTRDDRRIFRLSAALMPQWMRDCFAQFSRMDCLRRDLEPLAIV